MEKASLEAISAAEIIRDIISAYCTDQDDFDKIMETIADNNEEELLNWAQKSFTDANCPDNMKLEWN